MPPVFGPLSAVEGALVILRGWRAAARARRHTSAKNEASSPVMNSSTTTSAPAAPNFAEHHVDRRQRLIQRHCHDHALAGGKAIRLDHDRRALRADVGFCRLGIGEMLVGGGRNIVGAAQRLGEVFGAFELAGGPGRAKRLETLPH